MPVDPHPAEAAFESHDDAEMTALSKEHLRLTVADADYVRNTDLSGQFGGIFVAEMSASFNLDTGSVEADDGSSVIIDGAGNHFVRQSAVEAQTESIFTGPGDLTIDDDETADVIVIKKSSGAATGVYLPTAVGRARPITIVDGKFDAATNNITLNPKSGSGQKIMGGNTFLIDSNGASIRLRPFADGSGYY